METTVLSSADPVKRLLRPHPVRYEMMSLLMDKSPLTNQAFAAILAAHAEFIHAGGGGGRWATFVTSGGLELGLVLGVYVQDGKKVNAGSQAQLSHKRLHSLDLKGIELSYANCCGVSCQNQDLSGANLQGSLWVDADLTGSVLRGANLRNADLSRSQLVGCDFREADLTGADLENADLRDADLSAAILADTKLNGAYVRMPGIDWT